MIIEISIIGICLDSDINHARNVWITWNRSISEAFSWPNFTLFQFIFCAVLTNRENERGGYEPLEMPVENFLTQSYSRFSQETARHWLKHVALLRLNKTLSVWNINEPSVNQPCLRVKSNQNSYIKFITKEKSN